MKNKILIICGPTATGKTALGIKLAKMFSGEIVSADSRQVYKDMDIVTGKDVGRAKRKEQRGKIKIKNKKYDKNYYEIKGVRLWALDLVEPDEEFSVAHYRAIAGIVIKDILKREKLPIIIGGTGLYIKSLTENIETISVPRDLKLRKKLSNKNLTQLQNILRIKDFFKWQKMNKSDRANPRRLIRAIEVVLDKKKNRSGFSDDTGDTGYIPPKNDILTLGLMADFGYLKNLIAGRVKKRLESGAIEETRRLLSNGYQGNLPSMSAIGYCQIKMMLEDKLTYQQMKNNWIRKECQYAKSQMMWFRKQRNISWFDISQTGNLTAMVKLIKLWYNSQNKT